MEFAAEFQLEPADRDRGNVVGLKHLLAVDAAVNPVDQVHSAALVGRELRGTNRAAQLAGFDTHLAVPGVFGAQERGTLCSAQAVVQIGEGGQAKTAVDARKPCDAAAEFCSEVRQPVQAVAVVPVQAKVGLRRPRSATVLGRNESARVGACVKAREGSPVRGQ